MLHLPLWASTIGQIRNSQSFVAGAGLTLGENHFPTSSLTWREMLTGLTTCLFYHGPDNPGSSTSLQLNSCKFRMTTTTTGQFHSGTQKVATQRQFRYGSNLEEQIDWLT
jgi:hypothetical protein